MPKLLPGQVAVVTGGAAGIGFALAESLVRVGLSVVIADANEQALDNALHSLRAQGAHVHGAVVDVSSRDALQALRKQVVERHGRVDVLCNNAGLYTGLGPLWDIDPARWRKLFEVNFWGVVNGVQEFVPLFLEQGFGHVLNMASMSGLSTVPGSADYSTSKHAVVALSETLRADLDMAGAHSIGVTVVCPAVVRTAMADRVLGFFAEWKASDERNAIGAGPDLTTALLPGEVAEAALQGLERGRLYVTPNPGSKDRFLKRIEPILKNWE